jgi:O-antigen ligase
MPPPATDRSVRWAAAPFLVAAFLQGMPLSLDAEAATTRTAADAYAANLEVVTTLGIERGFAAAVVWALLYGVAAAALVRGRRAGTILPKSARPALLLVLLIATSAAWSNYPAKVAMVAAHSCGAVLIALAAAHAYRRDPCTAAPHLGVALGLNVAVHVAAALAAPAVGVEWDGRWRGLTTNANTLGFVAFCSSWANVAALVAPGALRRRASVHLVLLVAAGLALVKSGSVTSALAAAFATSGVCAFAFVRRLRNADERRALTIIAGTSALAIATLVLVDFDFWSWLSLTQRLGKSSTLTGRADLWSQAVELIAARPFLGWSFDDNATVTELTTLPYLHFHNGYLDLGVRGGAVALGLVAWLLAAAYRGIGRTVAGGPDAAAAFRPMLLACVVYNLAEVSLAATRNVSWSIVLFTAFVAEAVRRSTGPLAGVSALAFRLDDVPPGAVE